MSPSRASLATYMGLDGAPTPSNGPLAALTERMAAGEETAFHEFHTAYFNRLFRYLLVLTRGDEHAARDAMQETLLRVVRHARRFEDEKSFWDWLALLARSAAADQGRKTSRYRRMLGFFISQPAETPAATDDAQLRAALARALETLSTEERDLLLSKHEQNISVRDLAAIHGVTEEALASRLARARRTLRQTTFRFLRHDHEKDS